MLYQMTFCCNAHFSVSRTLGRLIGPDPHPIHRQNILMQCNNQQSFRVYLQIVFLSRPTNTGDSVKKGIHENIRGNWNSETCDVAVIVHT